MLVIIGTGLAGYMLAKEWRKINSQTSLVMVTADDGNFYSKPLLSTALTQAKTADQLIITTAHAMAQELNAKIICNTIVEKIDPSAQHIILGDQSIIPYSQLVLACGAKKNCLQLQGDAVYDLQAVNNLVEYRKFRHWLEGKKQIAILGAGLVGCEFANDLLNAGYKVDLIAPESYPLASFLPKAVGDLLLTLLIQRGLRSHLGRVAKTLSFIGKQIQVILSDQTELQVDGVFSASGLQPETSLAEQAGIAVNRGILVNRLLQTNIPSIYALGDCAEVEGHVQMYIAPLLQCAKSLAKILVGAHEPVHYSIMPIVLKTTVLPLVFYPPPSNIQGTWYSEGEGHHLRMLFYDSFNNLRGFVLAGDKIRDKITLAKQLPVVFPV